MNRVLAYKPEHQSILIKQINGITYVYFSNGETMKETEMEDCENIKEFQNALRKRGFTVREISI